MFIDKLKVAECTNGDILISFTTNSCRYVYDMKFTTYQKLEKSLLEILTDKRNSKACQKLAKRLGQDVDTLSEKAIISFILLRLHDRKEAIT